MKRDSKKHIDNKSFKDTKDFQLTALEEEESQLADPYFILLAMIFTADS